MSDTATNPPDLTPAAGLICPKCGAHNATWRLTCAKCGARLVMPEDDPPPPPERVRRPAIMTGWALFTGLFVSVDVLAFVSGLAGETSFDPLDLVLMVGAGIALMAALIVIVGAWQMHRWARLPVAVLHGAMFALTLASMVTAESPTAPIESEADALTSGADTCSTIFWLGLNAFFVVWFVTNRPHYE